MGRFIKEGARSGADLKPTSATLAKNVRALHVFSTLELPATPLRVIRIRWGPNQLALNSSVLEDHGALTDFSVLGSHTYHVISQSRVYYFPPTLDFGHVYIPVVFDAGFYTFPLELEEPSVVTLVQFLPFGSCVYVSAMVRGGHSKNYLKMGV